jgi:hypothetical protein
MDAVNHSSQQPVCLSAAILFVISAVPVERSIEVLELTRDSETHNTLAWQTVDSVNGPGPITLTGGAIVVVTRFSPPLFEPIDQ